MASVEVSNVRKSFGSFEVIHGVSISVEDGEFVILVGPSGCGKSTLLPMVAGLESVSSGELPLTGASSTMSRQKSATSRWCSRTMRSIRK